MALLQLYIVRHGETAWNKERRIQGQLDVPLNEVGTAQAASVGRALKDVHFIKAFSSDLQRASKVSGNAQRSCRCASLVNLCGPF